MEAAGKVVCKVHDENEKVRYETGGGEDRERPLCLLLTKGKGYVWQ